MLRKSAAAAASTPRGLLVCGKCLLAIVISANIVRMLASRPNRADHLPVEAVFGRAIFAAQVQKTQSVLIVIAEASAASTQQGT
jgi:hypothetical protein